VRRSFALTASVLFVALAWCVPLFGLEPNSDISQYAHTSWKIRDGFLQGFVLSIAQTPDGYLWLGTERGLFRFDGTRARPWPSLSEQQLPSSYVASLLAARDGTLWIGTGKGLASWKAGKLIVYPELAGKLVQALREDDEGTLWAGGFAYTPPGTLCAIRSGTAQCYGGNGRFGNGVLGLYEDSNRNLWAGVLNGFWRWKPGPPLFYAVKGEPYGIQHFTEDRDGSLLIPIAGSIARLRNGEIKTAYRLPSTKHQGSGERILRDRDGALWVGTWSQGLVHLREGSTDSFAQRDGLSGDLVTALFEDREGNIWVGTTKGLDRFSTYSAATFSEQQGLSGGGNASVLAARDGSIWFSPHSQLYRFDRGQVTIYHRPGAGIEPTAEEGERRVREVTVAGLPGLDVVSLFQDHEGRIWVAGTGGVGYLQNDRFVSVNSVPGGVVDAMSGDSKGNLWISIVDRGLFHLFEDKLIQHISWAALGRNDLATVLAVDPSIGGVWLGFSKGGLARLVEGQTRPSFVTDPALDQGRVSDLRFDHEGALWVASEGGLSRIKNGRISTLTTKGGLPCDHIYWLAEDQEHSFWLYGSCGLMRIARSNLDAWLATGSRTGPKSIRATLFDETDGVTLRGDPSAGPQGRAAISPDGKIWFPTVDGLSVIDPHHLPFNPIPPPVHIEKIVADGKEYGLSGGLHLPAHVRDLFIDYTALSYVAPEKIHFRYKLESQDPNWREVVNDREVQYSNLPPGNYRFRVMACNNSGVWNEAGASLDFSIAPAYYQTTRFRLLCVVAFLAMLWALYQRRLHIIRRQYAAGLEATVGERMRVARELHDTLLQSFQGVAFQLQAARRLQLRKADNAEDVLDEAIQATEEAIQEGRSAIRDLRPEPATQRDLPELLNAVGNELATPHELNGSAPAYSVVVEGKQHDLSPMLQDEVYRIAREVIRNAFAHAVARHIEVEIRYDQDQLRVRVRDDGKGIDPKILAGGGQSGHWGISGMRERAQRIGSRLDFWSEIGAGTEVQLTVPATMAYEKRRHNRRFRLFNKAGSDEQRS
jgi:signal transduction histidine kinase/ligand-binding sensor domain-containing protein